MTVFFSQRQGEKRKSGGASALKILSAQQVSVCVCM